jgi:hypothetical protein
MKSHRAHEYVAAFNPHHEYGAAFNPHPYILTQWGLSGQLGPKPHIKSPALPSVNEDTKSGWSLRRSGRATINLDKVSLSPVIQAPR